ncbi:hypothetical protein KPH14_003550 [Odynerus spinipes]|uniref:AB hydrolase-1 domain-containing protein n=1 Tax=Odynerus spinipes TaxID=1348599 RepID=A0AAD9VK35_9HYME|nr:hypothetical protein KPH14_003550 [Odynerus spinipes]
MNEGAEGALLAATGGGTSNVAKKPQCVRGARGLRITRGNFNDYPSSVDVVGSRSRVNVDCWSIGAVLIMDLLDNISSVPKLYYGVFFGLAFSIYYLFEVVQTPLLVCGKGPFLSFLEEHVSLVKNKFWPTLWCFESRAQTVLASILRARILPPIRYRREILVLSDGGEVALDWAEENCNSTSPIVIILPGLTGASTTEYVKCLASAANKSRIRCVIFMNRGLGGVTLKTPRTYCATNCEDLEAVIEHVRKLNPNVPLGATGISMGGLILGNYLVQNGAVAKTKLQGCFIISVPWNVFAAGENTTGKNYLNSILNKHLTNNLCHTVRRCYSSLERGLENINWDNVLRSRSIREFDTHFTVKQFGYKDVEEYYQKATLHDKLHLIQVPVLCLNAADDPFQPFEAIPLNESSKTENVAIAITSRGGHIGFLEGIWPIKEEQYMSKLFCQFYTALFTVGKDLLDH